MPCRPLSGYESLSELSGRISSLGAVATFALLQALSLFHPAWGSEMNGSASALADLKHLKSLNDIPNFRFEALVDGSIRFSVDDPRTPEGPYTKKHGLADSEGRVVVPPVFESMSRSPGGTGFLVRRGTEVGFVDHKGRYVRSQGLSAVAERGFVYFQWLGASGSILVEPAPTRGAKVGVVDLAGRWIVEPDYSRIYEVEGKLFGCRSAVSCELIPSGAAIKASGAATFWQPLTATLGTERRECARGPCYALVRLDGSAAIDEVFDLLEWAGPGYVYFVRQGGRTAGLFKLRPAGIATEIAARKRFGSERPPLFSEGRAFACRPGTVEERSSGPLNAYFCNYVNEQGDLLTGVNYSGVGSQFFRGRAVACRTSKIDERLLSLCAWLDSRGNEGAKTPWVDGVSVLASDENLAVLQIAMGYRFFYRDGRLRDFPNRRI